MTQSKLEMTPDEALELLKEIEDSLRDKLKEGVFPYEEHYLEYLVNLKDAPDRFFTLLATKYIDKLF